MSAPDKSRIDHSEIRTLLGPGSSFEGKLAFDQPVRLEGVFRGEIRSDSVLVVAEGADVRADVLVRALIVTGGRIEGDLRATESIELHVPATAKGSLRAPEIFLDKGVLFEGSCTMGPVET